MNDDKTIKLTSDQIATDNCVECAKPCCSGACEVRSNLECTNWLSDIPGEKNDFDIVEVHFKNTRRGFYRNSAHLQLKQGACAPMPRYCVSSAKRAPATWSASRKPRLAKSTP